MNTSTTATYPDVDAAAIKWDKTEGYLDWDEQHIISACRDAIRVANDPKKCDSYKLGYIKVQLDFIETFILSKA